MAITRKGLRAMGLEDEKIDEIIEMHTETVNALKDQRDQYREDAEKLESVSAELAKLKADHDPSEWQKKYEEEHSAFEAYKTEQAEKETAQAKASAYKQLLIDAGVSEKRLDSIMRVTDLSEIELKDGKLTDAETLTAGIKETWADFITTANTSGAGTQSPPPDSGTPEITKEQFMNMGYAGRLQLYNDNPELYQTLKGE